MGFNPAAMAAFATYAIANVNGRKKDLAGRDLNVDGRFGYQCMDLWIWLRYRLGFTDNLPTPDAAAVWEMNWTAPDNRMWEFFDSVSPGQPAYPGDIGIMNRAFFGNGVGHIFMIVADLGVGIRVLELNGLGDGFEDDAGGQHGSPGRIHEWPKTYLYGYLRWIGPAPTVSGQSNTIDPIQEDDMPITDADAQKIAAAVVGHQVPRTGGGTNTLAWSLGAEAERTEGIIARTAEAAARAVLTTLIPRGGPSVGGETTLAAVVAYSDQSRVDIINQQPSVTVPGLDQATVNAAISAGVQAALKDTTATVTLGGHQ